MTEADRRQINLAVRRLLQSAREMQSTAARRLGVHITDVQAMDLVTASRGLISPAELAERLGIRTASVTALIDRLVAAGHLERSSMEARPNGGRRRRTNLRATEHARREIRETLRPVNEGFDALADGLSPDEAAVVLDFLARATVVLRDYARAAQPAVLDDEAQDAV